jgi:hypothetical protein
MRLCKNRGWLVSIMIWSIGASVYYAFALIWPSMVLGLYADGDIMWAGWVSGVVGAGITLGEILAGFTKKRAHIVIRVVFFAGSALLAGRWTPISIKQAPILIINS